MRRVVLGLISAAILIEAAALAQVPVTPQLTPDQKGFIAYDQCVMHAAIKASHTDANNDEVLALAKAQCAATRAQITAGREANRPFLAALDAADADKSANFPAWIKGVRERRKSFEGRGAVPTSPPRP
jgi:hypothetical protein